MNVDLYPPNPIPASLWEEPEMRRALADRDIPAVYTRLRRHGITHRRIAALVGQAPSEVYEILNGRRIMSYDVLVRIADGLGIPRGYMGLDYDPTTKAAISGRAGTSPVGGGDEQVKRRKLIARAAAITLGAATLDVGRWLAPVPPANTPVPDRIGMVDVEQVRKTTQALRSLDYQYGGGACREATVGYLGWANQLLRAGYSDDVGRELSVALADLHNLAGWTAFDIGHYDAASHHFTLALEQAKHVDDASLVAGVLYRMGRLYLHRNWFDDALRLFQLGQIAAQDSGCELTVATLCANEAMAHAMQANETQAKKSLGRAEDEFARATPAEAAPWVRFFCAADLHASTGVVYAALDRAQPSEQQYDTAVTAMRDGLDHRVDRMARSRVFELTALATVHLRHGDDNPGIQLGHRAVDLAGDVRSARVVDRLAPLHQAALARPGDEAADLARRIAAMRAA